MPARTIRLRECERHASVDNVSTSVSMMETQLLKNLMGLSELESQPRLGAGANNDGETERVLHLTVTCESRTFRWQVLPDVAEVATACVTHVVLKRKEIRSFSSPFILK